MKKLMVMVAFLVADALCGMAWGRTISVDLRSPAAAGGAKVRRLLGAAPSEGTLRSFNLDAGAADVGEVATGDELVFTLFDDVTITLTLGEQMPSPLGGDVFLAEASGYEGVKNAVVLRTADGLTIDVQDYLNNKVYKVISTPAGVKVEEIEPVRNGKCGCDALEPPGLSYTPANIGENNNAPSGLSALPSFASTKGQLLGAAAQQGDTCVDILVAYDKNAAAYANYNGGGITNFAQVAVQKMNTALANTGLDASFRFRLVGVIAIEATHDTLHKALNAATYAETGWESVKAKRDEVGADIVTVLIDTGSGGDADGVAGLGWALSMSYRSSIGSFKEMAFNACVIRAVADSHTMTHECGHNLGAGHSIEQTSQPGPQLYDYSAGYYFTGSDSKKYCTIMAYEDESVGGTRVPYFSSPDYAYMGVAVGDSVHDNTLTIRNTFAEAAQWRTQKVPMSYDVVFEPASGATFDGSLEVTLAPGKDGVEIRYTIDGSDPTSSSSLYNGAITITERTTIKASTVINGVCSLPYSATYYSQNDLGYALGLPDMEWTTSMDAPWEIQSYATIDGVGVKAEVIAGTNRVLSAQVTGPATLTFKCAVEIGTYGRLLVTCNGNNISDNFFWKDSTEWGYYIINIPEGKQEISLVAQSEGSSSYAMTCYVDDMKILYTDMPVFVPTTANVTANATVFTNEMMVAIEPPNKNCSIYYTLDGSDPNEDDAILYDGPFFITRSTRLKAIAVQPGRGASAVAEGQYIEKHRPRAGEWTRNGDGAFDAVKEDGRMICVMNWNYPGCYYSSQFYPIIESDGFKNWAELNGIYLVAVDCYDAYPEPGTESRSRHFSPLFSQTGLSIKYFPILVFASAQDTSTALGGMWGYNSGTINGITYNGTVPSIIECFASVIDNAKPLGAPVASVTDAYSKRFPFDVTLSNTNGTGTIYYTLDGSTPTRANGTKYSDAVTIEKSGTVLKAVVWPDDENAVSGIPLVLQYVRMEDGLGTDGMTWTNQEELPWQIESTSYGLALKPQKDPSLPDVGTTSVKARVNTAGILSFGYRANLCYNVSALKLKVNGELVLDVENSVSYTRFQYVLRNANGAELEWIYSYYAPWEAHSQPDHWGAWLYDISWRPASPPYAVTGLTASNGEYSYGTLLRWSPVANATSYAIYRSESNDPSVAERIGTTTQIRYWDTSGVAGKTYWYWVKTINTYGESGFSESASGWRPIIYSIAYNANGGKGTMYNQYFFKDQAQMLSSNEFTRIGWAFMGWSTSPEGPVVYSDREIVSPSGNVTLYAVWERDMIWTINSSGTLTSVDMNGLTVAVIPKSVTRIGPYAFTNCTAMTEVTIPDSVKSIEHDAFRYCTGLRRVNVSSLEAWLGISFSSWTSNPLEEGGHDISLYVGGELLAGHVTIPEGVENINIYSFAGYKRLTDVSLPQSLRTIGWGAFYGTSISNVVVPDGVTSIGYYAFMSCSKLETVIMGEGVQTIQSQAFSYCPKLKRVVIGGGTSIVDNDVFYGSSAITELFVPSSLKDALQTSNWNNISESSIRYYDSIARISFNPNGGEGVMSRQKVVAGYVFSLNKIAFTNDDYVFAGWTLESDGNVVYEDGANITVTEDTTLYAKWVLSVNVTFDANGGTGTMEGQMLPQGVAQPLSNNAFRNTGHSFEGWATSPDGPVAYADGESISIEEDITLYAVWGDGPICTIENGVLTEVDMNGCTSIVIPSGVTSIGDSVFYGNTSLTEVVIPEGVTNIARYAFRNCTALESVTMPASMKSIGFFAFYGCRNLSRVNISDIGAWCGISFYDSSSNPLNYAHNLYVDGEPITVLTIPDGISEIKAYAFYGSSSLENVILPASLSSIGSNAFYGCDNLTGVYVEDVRTWCGISFAGNQANPLYYAGRLYIGDTLLTELEIPVGVSQVKNYAFYNCTSLTSIVVPGSVSSIGNYSFSNCTALRSATIAEGVQTIGQYAFNNCSVLSNISLPANIATVGKGAFSGCNSLATDGFIIVQNILYGYVGSATSIAVPNNVVVIADNAFANARSLSEVTIPSTVQKIGASAFYYCSNLESVTLVEGLQDIGSSAFTSCGKLAEIVVPNTVTNIGSSAFSYCNELASLILGNSIVNIGGNAFDNCVKLTEVLIPNSVITMDYGTFGYCSGLKRVIAPAHLKTAISQGRIFFQSPSDLEFIYYTGSPDSLSWLTLSFDANGGESPKMSQQVLAGCTIGLLPKPRKAGHRFVGWFTSRTGGEQVTDSTIAATDIVLYARWEVSPFETGGDADWTQQSDGSWKSGKITHNQTTWIEKTVSGTGTLTFQWKVSSESYCDELIFYIDEVSMEETSGTRDWLSKSYVISSGGLHVFKWEYSKDGSVDSGSDCGWIKDVVWTPDSILQPLNTDAAPVTVTNAIDSAAFADAEAVKVAIGGNATNYNQFVSWAKGVAGGEAAVVASTNAAVSYLLGAERLFVKQPTIEIGDVSVGEGESSSLGTTCPTEVTVSVVVKDGEDAVKCAAEKVKNMFEATGDLDDWDGAAKLMPAVKVEDGDGATMRFKVTPGDGTASRAFLRVRVK